MKLTKNIISRSEACKISKDYVAFVEGNFDKFSIIQKVFDNIKRRQKALTYIDGQFVIVNISSIDSDDFRAIDGPIVRVSNGEYSWRVDGNRFAFPIPVGVPKVEKL